MRPPARFRLSSPQSLNPVELGLVASLRPPWGEPKGVANMDLDRSRSSGASCYEEGSSPRPPVWFSSPIPTIPPTSQQPRRSRARPGAGAHFSLVPGRAPALLEVSQLPPAGSEEAFAAIAREPPHALIISWVPCSCIRSPGASVHHRAACPAVPTVGAAAMLENEPNCKIPCGGWRSRQGGSGKPKAHNMPELCHDSLSPWTSTRPRGPELADILPGLH